MRKLFTLLLAFSAFFSNATDRTATANIDQGSNKGWQNPNNWNPVGVPQNGDVAIIPAGMIITVKGNVYSTSAKLTIKVNGTLDFDPSGTLNLSNGSVVQLYTSTAKITTNGTSSEQIIIAGDIKYSGQNDGTITGPAYTSEASLTSTPGSPGASFVGGVLPVKLTGFTATEKNGSIKINWTTVSETGIKNFEVQRTSDGSRWKTIKVEAPKNICQCATNYEWVDGKPEKGINLYRLISNDFDGRTSVSSTIAVKMETGSKNAVLWSSTASGLNLQLDNTVFQLPVQVQLFSAGGQLIQSKTITQYSVSNLLTGSAKTVLLTVRDEHGNFFSTRIIK